MTGFRAAGPAAFVRRRRRRIRCPAGGLCRDDGRTRRETRSPPRDRPAESTGITLPGNDFRID